MFNPIPFLPLCLCVCVLPQIMVCSWNIKLYDDRNRGAYMHLLSRQMGAIIQKPWREHRLNKEDNRVCLIWSVYDTPKWLIIIPCKSLIIVVLISACCKFTIKVKSNQFAYCNVFFFLSNTQLVFIMHLYNDTN